MQPFSLMQPKACPDAMPKLCIQTTHSDPLSENTSPLFEGIDNILQMQFPE